MAFRVLCNVLTQQPHPPRNIAQPIANGGYFFFVMANVVKFEFGWLHRLPILVTPHRAQHQPPPSHFRITPFGHHIRSRSQDQVNMIRQDRLTQQIDAEVPSLMHKLVVNP